MLAAAWDDSTATQPERAYCARFYTEGSRHAQLYVVDSIFAAETIHAGAYGVIAGCPDRPNIVVLHTHPPTTCGDTQCQLGGSDAYQCEPSPGDQRTLDHSSSPFAAVQCDRWAVVFFWNAKLVRPPR